MIKEITVNENKKVINIDFNQIFNDDELPKAYSSFAINKSSYYSIMKDIAEDLSKIFERYEKMASIIINTKYMYYKEKPDETKFVKYITNNFVKNKELNKVIEDIVEENYSITCSSENASVVIEELQVDDEMNKAILRSAFLMRILIPIVNIYEGEHLFKKVNKVIIKRDGLQVYNKLYKFVSSRVKRTNYSDKVIWKFLINLGKDPEIVTINLLDYIIENNIPKIKVNKSSICFLDVIIKKQISFIFRFNYLINFKPIKINELDSDKELEERNKLDSIFLSNDEGIKFINDITIENYIRDTFKRFKITREELLEKEFKGVKLNTIQEYFLKIFYYKKFRLSVNKDTFMDLILCMYLELIGLNFKTIPLLLHSNIKENERIFSKKRKILEKIYGTEKYDKIQDNFSYVKNIFNNNNLIFSLLTIKEKKFLHPVTNEPIVFSYESLAFEIIDLLELTTYSMK